MKCSFAFLFCALLGIGQPLVSGTATANAGQTVINVRDSGARGNGTDDDGPAIQAAIDSASARGGDSVYLPQSNSYYRITAALHLKSGVVLYGDGDGSWIRRTAPGGAVIDVDDQSNFSIRHLRISGSGMLESQSTFGIDIHNGSHDGSVSDCRIDNHYLGIAVLGVSDSGVSSITISRNTIINTGLNPIGINTRGQDISVSENTIDTFGSVGTTENIAAGVEMRGVIGGTVSSNTIKNGYYHFGKPVVDGIRIEYLSELPSRNPKNIECSGNVIDSIGGYGIRGIYARSCLITNNNLHALGTGGIYLVSSEGDSKTSDGNTISGNRIDRAHDGIYLESTRAGTTNYRFQCTHNDITGNTVLHSGQYGLHIWGGSGNTITSNQIIGSADIGIYQHGGSNNTYSNNTITDASLGAHAPLPACLVAGDTNNVFINCSILRSDPASNQVGEIRIGEHAVGTVVTPESPSGPPINYRPNGGVSVTVVRALNLIGITRPPK